MLFNFDENGNPQVYSKAEDERNAMSLQYLVSHWSDAMEDMNSNSFVRARVLKYKMDSITTNNVNKTRLAKINFKI